MLEAAKLESYYETNLEKLSYPTLHEDLESNNNNNTDVKQRNVDKYVDE